MLTEVGPRVRRNAKTYSLYRCECGQEVTKLVYNVQSGHTTSCGCARKSTRHLQVHRVKHGMYKTPTHNSWIAMIQRTTNPHVWNYKDYGGRGITVCDRWRTFDNFYADMGERPEGKTLDRIDVNGNYVPGNCRWATATEQRMNQRCVFKDM